MRETGPPTEPEPKRPRHRLRSRTRAGVVVTVLIVLVGPILLAGANGTVGAHVADVLRGTIGAQRTAQVEGVYLGAADSWQHVLFVAGITKVQAPWAVPSTPMAAPKRIAWNSVQRLAVRAAARSVVGQPVPIIRHGQVLQHIPPLIRPALAGEGVWTPSVAAASTSDPVPLIAKVFLRPDPSRPYAVATALRFDLRYLALHEVAGTTEPGGAVGMYGTGAIPLADQKPGRLLAAFNGGFKYADGAYGMMVNRTVYVPPVMGAATLGITTRGRVIMGAWGRTGPLSATNVGLVSWRQNGSLLIEHGSINPLAANNGAWGTTVLNASATWRSAIGLGSRGELLYVAGNSLTVSTLALTLKEVGARTAMELDINPFWVRADFYGRDPTWHLTMATLRSDMQGTGQDFLQWYSRDFFYLTRIAGRSRQ